MNFKALQWLATAIAVTAIFNTAGAIAATEFEINNDTGSVNSKELTAGAIKVIVDFEPIKFDNSNSPKENNLSYQIFYNNKLQISAKESTYYTGGIALKDLDSNGTVEVLIRTFSGGAHCCTNLNIYTWQKNKFAKLETGMRDGGGGEFLDLDGDRKLEFVSFDQSFLYRYSSYAGSFPPSTIYSFRNGKLVDTTRQHPKYLRSTAWQMYQSFLASKRNQSEVNGVLAGYVAQKALLGEFEQGWKFMLANCDRASDWGLDIYDKKGNVIGRHPNFPVALRSHLKESGYLK